MKQSIKTITATLVFTLGIFSFTVAQDLYAGNQANSDAIILNVETAKINSATAESNFHALFPQATNHKWSISEGTNFVSFQNLGRKATASFNHKGEFSYSITDCGIEHLPAAFSKILKNDYNGYQLFHAIEIKAHGKTAYQVVIDNAEGFITLKYTSDGADVLQRIKK